MTGKCKCRTQIYNRHHLDLLPINNIDKQSIRQLDAETDEQKDVGRMLGVEHTERLPGDAWGRRPVPVSANSPRDVPRIS